MTNLIADLIAENKRQVRYNKTDYTSHSLKVIGVINDIHSSWFSHKYYKGNLSLVTLSNGRTYVAKKEEFDFAECIGEIVDLEINTWNGLHWISLPVTDDRRIGYAY